MINLQTEGRRTYIVGDTYAIKDRIKAAGGRWDGDRRAWWLGNRSKAEALLADIGPAADAPAAASERAPEKLTDDSEIEGRAKYKGKTYVLVWSGTTKRGPACKLAFVDGSSVFWADAGDVQIVKVYRREDRYGRRDRMTFGRLKELRADWAKKTPDERAEDERARELGGRCRCAQPLDEGDGECMKCGYLICD